MRTLLAPFLLLPLLAISSQATDLTETFTGTVTVSSSSTSDSFYTPPVGSAVSGSVTFDTAAMIEGARTNYSGGVSAVITDVNGSHTSTGNPGSEILFGAPDVPTMLEIILNDISGSTEILTNFSLLFADGTLATHSPTDLPVSALSGGSIGSIENVSLPSTPGFTFNVSTFTPADVMTTPEPGTLGMIALAGLSGVLVRRLRLHRKETVHK